MSEWMRQQVRVLCLVTTHSDGDTLQNSSAAAVRDTWGAHCDHLLFLSPQPHPGVETLVVNTSEARQWSQTRRALEFVLNKTDWRYDWILKADDKAFVVMENLRLVLYKESPAKALFTGALSPDLHLISTAGYVISHVAARRLVAQGRHDAACRNATEEDAGVVLCMSAVGARFFVANDNMRLPVFYELPPEALMEDVLQGNRVDKCCSSEPAVFHGLLPSEIRATHCLLRRLKPGHRTSCGASP